MATGWDLVRVAIGAGVLASAVAAAADIPDPVKKLNGSSDDTARSVMTQQGYGLRSQKTSWGRDYSYWWKDKSSQCVQLMSVAGTDETAYITWTDGRQCLGVRVVSDRYERVDELDKGNCYIK